MQKFCNVLLIISFFIVIFAASAAYWDYSQVSTLSSEGIRVDANVISYYPCCGRNQKIYAEIKFDTVDNRIITARIPFADKIDFSDENFRYVYKKRTIPIVYDSENTSKRDLNFRGEFYRRNPFIEALEIFAVVGGGLLLGPIILFAIAFWGTRRSRSGNLTLSPRA